MKKWVRAVERLVTRMRMTELHKRTCKIEYEATWNQRRERISGHTVRAMKEEWSRKNKEEKRRKGGN